MGRLMTAVTRRWRGVEADASQRYRDYIEYRRGRQDGRLGQQQAGSSPAYIIGFELGRQDAQSDGQMLIC